MMGFTLDHFVEEKLQSEDVDEAHVDAGCHDL